MMKLSLHVLRNSFEYVFLNSSQRSRNKRQMILAFLSVSAFCMLFFNSCKKEKFVTPPAVTIYEAIKADVLNFSMLRAAVDRAGLKEVLESEANLTLFAPINQAFIDAGYANVAAINAADPTVLANILKYHLVDNRIEIAGLTAAQTVIANSGAELFLDKGAFVTRDSSYNLSLVNGTEIISKDIAATNGNFQAINRILIPKGADILTLLKSNNNYSLFVAAINRASQGTTNFNSLLSGTTNYTVFTPINNAFNSFLGGKYNSVAKINAIDPDVVASELVGYHIITDKYYSFQLPLKPVALNQSVISVAGSRASNVNNATYGIRITINGIALNVFGGNKLAANGIVNEITSVLTPPSSSNLLQLIQANTNLTFLKAVIDRASTGNTNYNALLSGSNALTIFAPTNAALQAEGFNSVSTIALASPATLAVLLDSHLFLGEIYSTSNPPATTYNISSANGLNVTFNNGTTYTAQGPNNTTIGTINPSNTGSVNGVFNVINVVLK